MLDDLTSVELDLARASVADARGEAAAAHLLGAAVDRAARRFLVRPFLLVGPRVAAVLAALPMRPGPASAFLLDEIRPRIDGGGGPARLTVVPSTVPHPSGSQLASAMYSPTCRAS
jgi:hypothetical protein